LINRLERESPSHIVRLRCNLLKLSSKKLSTKEVSRLAEVKRQRISDFFDAWGESEKHIRKSRNPVHKRRSGGKVKVASGEGHPSGFAERKLQKFECYPCCFVRKTSNKYLLST